MIYRCPVVLLITVSVFLAHAPAQERVSGISKIDIDVLNQPAKEVDGLALLFHEDFNDGDGALKRFTFSDSKAWKIDRDTVDGLKKNVLAQFQASKSNPPVRSPFNQGWINDLVVGPFVMEVKLRSTKPDYGHRDMCLFFGGVDASHLFYVHLGKVPDPHCHNIFIVDGAPRKAIAEKVNEGAPWDDKYHTVRLSRDEQGNIKVFWDGRQIMTAKNDKFPAGKLGVGSFDDVGNFTRITVWGRKARGKD
jgi:hypothetical protein